MAWTAPKTWAFQEGVESSELNTHLRDNLLAVGPHYMLMKSADQSVVASTTLVNDTHMVLPVGANEVWKFELSLLISSNATADFKVGWSVPSGTTMRWGFLMAINTTTWLRDASGAAGQNALDTEAGSLSFNTPGTGFIAHAARGFIFTSSTTGDVVFQWAQNVASGTTTLHRGSCMEARRGVG